MNEFKADDMLLSDYLGIDYEEFDMQGTFDPLINRDRPFFINILRLKKATVPEFKDSYQSINDYFSEVATLLEHADARNISDKCFRAAFKSFDFSEVNGIGLGFSESERGAGFGKKLALQVIGDAYDIVKKGIKAPELFHLLQLFEDNVGPDRLSDMIATLILPDIRAYTRRIMRELSIDEVTYTDKLFTNGFLYHPTKGCEIYLLPIEILHKLPVAESWGDIDRVVVENNAIRDEINQIVGDKWARWASTEKKSYLKQRIFMDADICKRVIAAYRKEELDTINLEEDLDYFIARCWQRNRGQFVYNTVYDKAEIDSLAGAEEIVDIFTDWVENNRGWDEILAAESRNREKSVQRLIHLCAKYYLKENNLDLSCEANEGPGPVDFKISRGNDKTVVELKLSSNQDYLHGYENQVQRYATAEHTEKMIYVLVDVGNPQRIKAIRDLHSQNKAAGLKSPELFIIDSTEQRSASRR